MADLANEFLANLNSSMLKMLLRVSSKVEESRAAGESMAKFVIKDDFEDCNQSVFQAVFGMLTTFGCTIHIAGDQASFTVVFPSEGSIES